MSFTELRHEIETAPRIPEAALRRALSHADELLPLVRGLIEKVKSGTYLLPDQDRLLFFGLHVLAAARAVALFPSWCELLRLSSDQIDEVFGDRAVPTITAITLSLMGEDDADAIFDLLAEPSVASDVRWGLFPVLARQTWTGQIERARTTAFLERFAAEDMAADDDFAWHGWVDAAALLGLTDFVPLLDRVLAKPAFRYDTAADRAGALARLHEAAANPEDARRFVEDGIAPIADPVAALSWLKRIEESEDADATEIPAGGERLADSPLTAGELGWLRGFLASLQVPATTMDLETLDGFFSALVAGPETVLPSDYMPYIWGGKDPADGPVFDDETQPRFIWGLLQRYWNAIARCLGAGLPHRPFLFPDDDAERGRRWATGFSIGVSLRSEAWVPLIRDREAAALPAMIMALAMREPDYLGQPLTPALRRQLTDGLPTILLAIADFWRDKASRLAREAPRSRKVGRNDPCPCGSGRKYKKCCGANAGSAMP